MKKRSLSLKLFLALALSLLVTVMVFAIAFAYALNLRSERELGESSIGKLKVADAMVNHLKQSINRETLRLMINEAVKGMEDIKKRGAVLDTTDLLKLGKVIDALREIVLTDDSYHSIYLYPDDLDFVLTSTSGFVLKKDLNDTAWLKYYEDFRNHGAPLSWIDSRIPDDGKGFIGVGTLEYVMTCVFPLGPYTTPFRGALVVNFREESLSSRINSSNFDGGGYLAVINPRGDVVSHPDKKLLARSIAGEGYVKSLLTSTSAEGYFMGSADGARALVSFFRPRDGDWIYVGVFSLRPLAGKAGSLLAFIIGLSVLFLAVGIVVAFQISRRLYSPLQQLCEDIRKTKGVDFADEDDEMSVIRQALETMKKREGSLTDESYLSALLHGERIHFGDSGSPKVRFFLPHYVCALVSIDNYARFVKDYQDGQGHYARELILEITEQVLGTEFICAGITTDNEAIPLIVNTDEGDAGRLQARLRAAFQRVQREVTRVFDCTITIGIGLPRSSRDGIKDSFAEARQAVQLRLLFGCGSINGWTAERGEYYYPFDTEKTILKCLAQLDAEGIAEAIGALMRDLRSREGLSSDAALQMMNQLIGNTVVKTAMDLHADLAEVLGPSFSVHTELAKKTTLEEIEDWLRGLFGLLIDYQRRTQARKKGKFERIVEFIRANYRGVISITAIAEQVRLSYSHVRKIFKDHTGLSIPDYVNSIRIAEARQLLADDALSIKEIGCRLGYSNGQSFTRAFKKLEGMTPAEYRSRVAPRVADTG
jgi:AraC-like DNA-binding protein/GGDEF domain-containing protein